MSNEKHIAWIDVETTGLDPEKGFLLEVALIITDPDLKEAVRGDWLYDHGHLLDGEIQSSCEPFVMEMHTKNGLWSDLAEAEALLRGDVIDEELAGVLAQYDSPLLGGRNPSFDRSWLQVWLPQSAAQLHYRHIDETALRWMLDDFIPAGILEACEVGQQHRALDDIESCLMRVREYRKQLKLMRWAQASAFQESQA